MHHVSDIHIELEGYICLCSGCSNSFAIAGAEGDNRDGVAGDELAYLSDNASDSSSTTPSSISDPEVNEAQGGIDSFRDLITNSSAGVEGGDLFGASLQPLSDPDLQLVFGLNFSATANYWVPSGNDEGSTEQAPSLSLPQSWAAFDHHAEALVAATNDDANMIDTRVLRMMISDQVGSLEAIYVAVPPELHVEPNTPEVTGPGLLSTTISAPQTTDDPGMLESVDPGSFGISRFSLGGGSPEQPPVCPGMVLTQDELGVLHSQHASAWLLS